MSPERRIAVARAALEAARGRADAARVRGSEAERIRDFLALPPLSLPSPEDDALAYARERHAERLGHALRAYRELLRHLRAADIPAAQWPTPTPGKRWSDTLDDLKSDLQDAWQQLGARRPVPPRCLSLRLTEKQIEALQSESGLEVTLRPWGQPDFLPGEVRWPINESAARSGRVITLLLSGKDSGGAVLTGATWEVQAIYQGHRWVKDRSGPQLHLSPPRDVPADRRDFLPPGHDPVLWIRQRMRIGPEQGDPNLQQVPGTP